MDKNMSEEQSEEISDEEIKSQGDKTCKSSQTILKCSKCSKQYTNIKTWKQHQRDHMKNHKCEICGKSFTRPGVLRLHKKGVHKIRDKTKQTIFTCKTCDKRFSRKDNLARHNKHSHSKNIDKPVIARFSCRHCDSVFQNYDDLFHHVSRNHPLNQEGGRRALQQETMDGLAGTQHTADNEDNVKNVDVSSEADQNIALPVDESALRDGVVNRYIHPMGSERYDVLTFFSNIKDRTRSFLNARVRELGGIKWNLCVHVEMQRDDGEDVMVTSPYFRSQTYVTLSTEDFNEHNLNESMQKMFASLEKFMREGSGWYVKKVLRLEIHTAVYKPLGGSTYIPLPKTLACSKSLLNIENQDDKCFLYCLLASLHPASSKPEKVDNYLRYKGDIDMSGISYPVTLSHIGKVENQNQTISVNVFTYEDDTIVPLRITEKPNRLYHVNLLWLINGETSHFCLITNLNRFLSRSNTHRSQVHFCHYCLHGFYKKSSLEQHQEYCSRHGAQKVELPIPGKNDILKLKEYEKTLKVPFVIYADYETIITPLQTCQPNPEHSSTSSTANLQVCGFGYKVVSEEERYTKPCVIYRGEDAGMKLIQCLLEEQEEITQILSNIEPMEIEKEHINLIENSTQCCLCNKRFTAYDKVYDRIVRHHNHLTGKIIGPACNDCNLNCQQATFIPVIFHNLKNFDAHILCQNLGYFKSHRLQCIAQTNERYISFSLGKLRFIDSLQFLPASLETLVENLAVDGLQAFQHLCCETDSQEEAQLLLRKGVYPYEHFDSFERFNETSLPRKEQFYSSIKKEHICDEDYAHAQTVFKRFKMITLGEYHDLYLKTDVVLLSDVFEAFRKLCLRQYELDPCHFYTSPGLSWAACLKMTGVELQLLTDIDKILMVEVSTRGGISQVSSRYCKANNPYLSDFDPSKPITYLQYLDANNLYGWAMVQPLPVGEFAFIDKRNIQLFDVMTIPEHGHTGYILEVSLEYPKSLHDAHSCLPLAPVRQSISQDNLSPYAQHLLRKLNGISEDKELPKKCEVEKLLTTLEDKDHYILHYRNLQLYLSLGMKLKTIHRILKFKQEAWMKPYIDQNTILRQKATSTFQKNFYKLLNVSVFGKTMENVRRHKNIELVHTTNRLKKVVSKPSYKTSIIFNEDLIAAELYKTKVNLFKPIYCGMCILDLSKCLMYDFWYNYIKRRYGNTAQLQMTDTDSLLFSCQTDNIYSDMADSLEYFDTSDYPKDHALHSDANKKVLGMFKDESNGRPISEFIGLRSKCYSYVCDQKEEKRAKGVSKVTVKKMLRHSHYKKVVMDESSMMCSMTCLRSHGHDLFTETIHKTGLSAFDDKRYLVDAINSYPYGHYKIGNTSNNERKDEDCEKLTFSIVDVKDLCTKTLDEQMFNIGDFEVTPCLQL